VETSTLVRKGYCRNCRHHDLEVLNNPVPPPSTLLKPLLNFKEPVEIPLPGGLAGAFDVTTKGILHATLEKCEYWRLADAANKPPGVMGWWPSRAVTFLENHDTGSTQVRG
jgi:hypothetical protein